MPLEVPIERIVQRGLARFQIRREYERGFRLLSEPVLRRTGIRDFLTPHGLWLLATSSEPPFNYFKHHLSGLHPDDEAVVRKYAYEVHKMARKVAFSFPEQTGDVITHRFRGSHHLDRFRAMRGTRFFTPFGLVRFFKGENLSEAPRTGISGPGTAHVSTELEGNESDYYFFTYSRRANAPEARPRSKTWEEEVSKTRSTFLHELEHLHHILATPRFHTEVGLVSEVVSTIAQGEVQDKRIARNWWEYYKKKPGDSRFKLFATLVKQAASLKLSRLQRKKLATILSDPAVKRIENAKEVLDYVLENRRLLL